MTVQIAQDGSPKLKPSMASRRRKFVKEYVIDFNGARAARDSGYSAGSAKVQAHRLLKRPDVQSGIDAVVSELKAIAFSNISQLFKTQKLREQTGVDSDGEPIYQIVNRIRLAEVPELPEELTACIKSIRVVGTRNGGITTLQLYDKASALDKLMRYYGGYAARPQPTNDPETSLLDLISLDALPEPLKDSRSY